MKLSELTIGKSGRIRDVAGGGALRKHLLDMGLIPGTEVSVVKFAPMGDPMEIRVRGYELTLRVADAREITVTPLTAESRRDDEDTGRKLPLHKRAAKTIPHPGLGESGKFHPKGSGDPLPDDELLTFALVGNQNSGKTTLFNQLTGTNQHVGNFPGVTVDRKDGVIRGQKNTLITDLPGIYSMSPYSSEEMVSRDFILEEKPKAIINIVDATNIERNLYLTMQLLEMDVPVVVALNMMDELTGNGGSVDVNGMEELLGTPVVPISASRRQGIDELVDHAIHIARFQERPIPKDFCDQDDNGGAIHRCLHAVRHLIYDHAEEAGLPVRFAASKIIEGDDQILEALALDQNEKDLLDHIVLQMEKERGLDRSAAIADMRFSFISNVCESCVSKPHESREALLSRSVDRILTGRFTAIPIFIAIMGLVFYLTFNVIGALLQEGLAKAIDGLMVLTDSVMETCHVNSAIRGLVIDGIFTGVGSVLSFLPIIVTMFFFLSLLEDSGYIARVAFFMDKALRRMGLSGRSIVPMLIGFGCTVPAVMATRTLPSERDRKMTILLTPFMSCTAKLPIYAFFINAFFSEYKALIMVSLYVLGIVTGILAAFLYRRTICRGEPIPFVMELPNYRLPGIRNVTQLLWEKSKDFLQRAFSVILIATIIVWFLQSFDFRFDMVEDSSDSILAAVSGLMVPIFAPVGLGDWRIITALISGFMAKESVVSVLGVLFGTAAGISGAMAPLTAMALLVFSLLYTPCVAAIASIKRELGSRWALYVVIWQCALAWVAALLVRIIGIGMGLG